MATASGYPPPPPLATRDVAAPRHPLLEKGTYERLHRNEVIETRPHILHFGGFQIHKEHSHKLRILNTSPASLRVSVIGPSTPHFRLTYEAKGLLAPGMSEEIVVHFTPNEWRYHYDTIKIFCGDMGENMVVPIHAYPAANDISLPKIIDFGRVAIGTSRTKVVPLACKIPLQFEYEITVLEAHPDFQVSPLVGVIPPDDAANVTITFLPTRHRTARAELQFNVAQFDFDPVIVSIVGSSAPDIAKQELLQNAKSELAGMDSKRHQEGKAERVRTLQDKKNRGPMDASTLRADKHAVTSDRTQIAGRVPDKASEDMSGRADEMGSDGEAAGEAGQAGDFRFDMAFREVAKLDKEKELKSETSRGEDLLTPEEIERAADLRKQRHTRLREGLMQNDIARVESVLTHGCAAVPSNFKHPVVPQWDENTNDTFSVRLQVIDRFVRAGSKCLMRTRARRRAERLREALRAAGVVDRKTCRAWVEAENRAAASGAGRSAQGAGSGVAVGAGDDAERLELVRIPENFILPFSLPTKAVEVAAEARHERDVPPVGDFKELQMEPLSVRLDYRVMGYERYSHTMPPASSYMRLHPDRKRLDAAREELLVRGPCGDADAVEVPLAMPESCLLPPAHDALSLLVPSTECRTYVAYPAATECDPGYWLSQPPPLIEPLQTEPLLPPDIMSLERPWLEVWRPKRQIADPFRYSDPVPCSFAEAGGSLGPRAGCDAGGERLGFLPVGGFARDIPSDTDDDDRGEFELPPPDAESYQKALADMDGPITCERWRKEASTEERLSSLCNASSRAVRERLVEMNKDLSCANKLFLG